MKTIKMILLFALAPFFSDGQVLLDLFDNAQHIQVAGTYSENNVKRIYYTMEIPFLLYMRVSKDHKQDSSSWDNDTITYSESYLKNGLIEHEKQTLPNGNLYYLKEYFFDSAGTIVRTRETSNKRIRFYDFQEQTYHYRDRQIVRIDKIRFKSTDTVRTSTIFSYSLNNLEKVIETDNKNGDTLLFSHFKYNTKRNYIEEPSFIKDFCEARTTYYYSLDKKGRIVKVTHGLKGYKRNVKPDRKISYDKLIKIPNGLGFAKVERYDYKARTNN
jgi:hypothetical protein